MAVPSVPGAGLIVIEAELVFGGFETVLDSLAMAFDPDERCDLRSGWAPGGEEGQVSISDGAADQKATRPKVGAVCAIRAGIEIGQLHIGPVIEARPFGAFARG